MLLIIGIELTRKSHLNGAGSCYNAETQNKKTMPDPCLCPK